MVRIPMELFVPLVIVFGVLCFGVGILYMQYQRLKEAEQKAQEAQKRSEQAVQNYVTALSRMSEEHVTKWDRMRRKWEELESLAQETLTSDELEDIRKKWEEIEAEEAEQTAASTE